MTYIMKDGQLVKVEEKTSGSKGVNIGKVKPTSATIKTSSGTVTLKPEAPEDELLKGLDTSVKRIEATRKIRGTGLSKEQEDALDQYVIQSKAWKNIYNEMLKKHYPTGIIAGTVPHKAQPYVYGPEYSDFMARVDRQFQAYRKAVTGAQASFTELALLRPLLPDKFDPYNAFQAKTKGVYNEIDTKIKNMAELKQDQGYNMGSYLDTLSQKTEDYFK